MRAHCSREKINVSAGRSRHFDVRSMGFVGAGLPGRSLAADHWFWIAEED